MKLFYIAPLLLLPLLTGCKSIIETEVKLSDLLNSPTKKITGDLYVSVAACSSYEDSRLESEAVRESKTTVKDIFPEARYVECFQKKFDSLAHFNIPITLDKDDDSQLASNDSLNIISNKKELLKIAIPASINNRINKLEKSSFGMGDIELSVHIKVDNDLSTDHPFKVVSAYIDDTPYVYGALSSKKGSSFDIKLSDVSVGQARLNGDPLVLLH
ncbi:hypothetical protein [Marinomonas sp. THO17]|uniref:DUF7424 family protein n=1 Tax=Marinomonas sp. THO17 TaxID=3149048 RepID=UPI00336BE69D